MSDMVWISRPSLYPLSHYQLDTHTTNLAFNTMDKEGFTWSGRKRLPHPKKSPVPVIPVEVRELKKKPSLLTNNSVLALRHTASGGLFQRDASPKRRESNSKEGPLRRVHAFEGGVPEDKFPSTNTDIIEKSITESTKQSQRETEQVSENQHSSATLADFVGDVTSGTPEERHGS